ncbi:hypothetical protein [Proteus appendicitidis]|uniref:Uncharacterized protein n=1 Tax=Proteus appendicitidis TaxID=3034648 RepID=A0ABY8Y4V7_9GAMM|nr:hypothetical protein [Proteus sp. HZ0627]WIV87434.1 hypothetical protein QQS39_13295 [Proteus sp. HZ0627]
MKTEKISQVTIDTLNDQISEILGPPLKDQNIHLQDLLKHLDKININALTKIGFSKIDYVTWLDDFINSIAKVGLETPYLIDDIEDNFHITTNDYSSFKDTNEFHILCRLILLLNSEELRLRTLCIYILLNKASNAIEIPNDIATNITNSWLKYTLEGSGCFREIELVTALIMSKKIPIALIEKKRGSPISAQKIIVQIVLATIYEGVRKVTKSKKDALLFVADEITEIIDYCNSHKSHNEELKCNPAWVEKLKEKSNIKISSAWNIYPYSILSEINDYIQSKNMAIYTENKILNNVIKSIMETEHRAIIDNQSTHIANTYLNKEVKVAK